MTSSPPRPRLLSSILLLLTLCTILVHGRIEHTTIEQDDRSFIHLESFGFEPNGEVEVTLGAMKLWVLHADDYSKKTSFNIKLILHRSTSDVSDTQFRGCYHESDVYKKAKEENSIIEWDLPEMSAWDGETVYKHHVVEPGYYHLLFSNCEPQTQVSFTLKLTEYNVDSSGNRNYLSAGEANLPTLYFILSALFVVLLVVWVKLLASEREHVKPIHYVMLVVLVFKILTMFVESILKHKMKVTGTAHGWNVVYYFVYFVKSMLMASALVLIGTGWSYMKPFLTERDKQIFLIVLVISVIVNIATVVINETMPGAREWMTWRDMLYLLDMVCCCVLLLPIVWSIWHLKESALIDGRAARNLERLKRFRRFYLLLVAYIYWTRIVVFMVEATLAFEYTWVGNVCEEVAALVFYATAGYLFRPLSQNPYLQIGTDDDDDEENNPVSTALELDDR